MRGIIVYIIMMIGVGCKQADIIQVNERWQSLEQMSVNKLGELIIQNP